MIHEQDSGHEKIVLLTINLSHEVITPLDRFLVSRISSKIKKLGIGEVECTGSGGGAIDLEIIVNPTIDARQHLSDLMTRHFPKVSYELDDSDLTE